MKLKREIDLEVQNTLRLNNIQFSVDGHNRIKIHGAQIDWQAMAGMLYLVPKEELSEGSLPCILAPATFVYSAFYLQGKATILEVSTSALTK